jgi:phage shock protein PspC (stress-responsive transcriptional regulator)
MCRRLLQIINVDFDTAGQLLIIYCAFIKCLKKKNGSTMKQCISAYDSVRRAVLYNIVIEFGIPMTLVRLIEVCLNE